MALHFVQQGLVVGGIGDDGDTGVVLGGGADHGGAADVDVLDGIFQGDVGLGHGLAEGVEVHAHQVDGGDAVLLDGGQVLGQVAAGQDAAMHLGMQGLDAAVEHFREAGVVADFGDRQAGVAQHLGGAAGGQELDALGGQALGEFENAALIGNGNEGLTDFHGGCGERLKTVNGDETGTGGAQMSL